MPGFEIVQDLEFNKEETPITRCIVGIEGKAVSILHKNYKVSVSHATTIGKIVEGIEINAEHTLYKFKAYAANYSSQLFIEKTLAEESVITIVNDEEWFKIWHDIIIYVINDITLVKTLETFAPRLAIGIFAFQPNFSHHLKEYKSIKDPSVNFLEKCDLRGYKLIASAASIDVSSCTNVEETKTLIKAEIDRKKKDIRDGKKTLVVRKPDIEFIIHLLCLTMKKKLDEVNGSEFIKRRASAFYACKRVENPITESSNLGSTFKYFEDWNRKLELLPNLITVIFNFIRILSTCLQHYQLTLNLLTDNDFVMMSKCIDFAMNQKTKAHLIPAVMSDLVKLYHKLYDLKKRYGDDIKYIKFLNPTEPDLEIINYKYLAKAALIYERGVSDTFKNYKNKVLAEVKIPNLDEAVKTTIQVRGGAIDDSAFPQVLCEMWGIKSKSDLIFPDSKIEGLAKIFKEFTERNQI